MSRDNVVEFRTAQERQDDELSDRIAARLDEFLVDIYKNEEILITQINLNWELSEDRFLVRKDLTVDGRCGCADCVNRL